MIAVSEQIHEGEWLKEIVRRSGKTQEEFAAMLGMVRGTLIYHMGKRELSDDFKKLLQEAGIQFPPYNTNVKQTSTENKVIDIILKNERWAQLILPHDLKKEDIDILMEQLKLMLKSMQ